MNSTKLARNKIKKREELLPIRESLRQSGKRVVFTNGCFDILHIGHVRYLEEAAMKGDCLIVGVNSDSSVKRLKGVGRPVMPDMERAELLAAFYCVDYVTVFSEETPEPLLLLLQPDVHVKGGDYRQEELPEAKVVGGYGGEVIVVSFVPEHSTTGILERVRQL